MEDRKKAIAEYDLLKSISIGFIGDFLEVYHKVSAQVSQLALL